MTNKELMVRNLDEVKKYIDEMIPELDQDKPDKTNFIVSGHKARCLMNNKEYFENFIIKY